MANQVVDGGRRRRAGPRAAVAVGVLCALLAAGCGVGEDRASSTESGPARLLSQLRDGGAVIVFRHAGTDSSMPDAEPVDLDDCSTQRNLDGAGRADARRIGAAFRELRIPVGRVWTSPYCRARDTAELAFGRADVVRGLERLYPELDEVADRRLNRLIRDRAPATGERNLVIAGHGIYPSALKPAITLDEGEAAIYSVRGSEVRLLGQVAPDEWARLGGRGQGAPRPQAAAGGAGSSAVPQHASYSVVAIDVAGRGITGAGFRVDVDRIVVTSAHAVGNADEVSVVLRDATRRAARVLGRAPEVDLAALELTDDAGLAPMHSGSGLADLRVGDRVSAVGARGRASTGAVRALVRPVRLRGGGRIEALQTDIATGMSHSGGPLLNTRGEVVGVGTALATRRGAAAADAGFAIPVDVAKREVLAIVAGAG